MAGNISSMALILSPSIPPALRCLLPVPNLTITNAMACKVFRDMKLGRIHSDPMSDLSYSLPSIYQDSGFVSKENSNHRTPPGQLTIMIQSECSLSSDHDRTSGVP